MSYYRVLGLENEPFSTSPDPAFFYESASHKAALYRLQITIKLKRGLSMILGDVGVGKTTLSRRLFQLLKSDDHVTSHLILNPMYGSDQEFVTALLKLFKIPGQAHQDPGGLTVSEGLSRIERHLFEQGVEGQRTTVLLIDEAQRLSPSSLELLRALLNYETNEYKLLQLVLMGQIELLPLVRGMKNFWDRISLRYVINPLDEEEARLMIAFRLRQAGHASSEGLFTTDAIHEIHQHTQGYPRRIAALCHDALEQAVMLGKTVVDEASIHRLIKQESQLVSQHAVD